jgi:hypothetical protein
MIKRPSLLKVLFYLCSKYLVFFTVLAFLDNRFKTIVLGNNKNADDIALGSFEYFIEILFSTFLFIVILFIPIYLLLKLRSITYILPAFIAIVVVEYFLYEGACSYVHFDIDGILNGILSIVFFFIFFGKFIISLRFAGEKQAI